MVVKGLAGGRGESGFTLVELAVSLLVTVEVLVAVLLLFDFSNRVSRVQTHIADLQQSMRAADEEMERSVRMAGRGGLPMTAPTLTTGAVRVIDDVPVNSTIGGPGTPEIVTGSDVLVVRGVFSTPIYQINKMAANGFVLLTAGGAPTSDPALAARGRLRIEQISPTGVPQNRQALVDLKARGIPDALILVNGANAALFAVVQFDPANSDPDNGDIAFIIRGGGGAGDLTAQYRALSTGGDFPAALDKVSYVGILEEYRYYVRRDDAGPRLSRARVFPNTDTPYGPGAAGDPANWQSDVADNVLDLQLALGFDSSFQVAPAGGGAAGPLTLKEDAATGSISESADGANDDWLYNSPNDVPANPAWVTAPLYYVRWSLLARTARRDPGYEAPVLTRIENRTYAAADPLNRANAANGTERMYRRRIIQTVVNLRNL
jgi:hypothetical protein